MSSAPTVPIPGVVDSPVVFLLELDLQGPSGSYALEEVVPYVHMRKRSL